MDVFIPAKKDSNPFFDEIIKYSRHNFIFQSYKKYDSSYKTVLIHWPEQLFHWEEPSLKQLEDLSNRIKLWKRHSKIVYVVHNLENHKGMSLLFRKLYDLIEGSCDSMVHFGTYSCDLFKAKFPEIAHRIIYHPLYTNSFKIFSKEYSRKQLGINKNTLVVIAPGSIRNREESKLVLNAFRGLKTKKKVLIVPRMLEFDLPFEFKGRTFLKRFIDIKKYYIAFKNWQYKKPTYIFNYSFLNHNDLALLMSASDIVFIPRIKILNSGNMFLAMTYKKIMIGPNQGNLTEFFELFKLPVFNPKEKTSVNKALNDACILFKTNKYKYDADLLNKFSPHVIALQWDELIDK